MGSATYRDLINTVTMSVNEYDLDKISLAYSVAAQSHLGQVRRSGELYISHPIAVANILANLGMDTDSIVAALLHDVVEDTVVEIDYIKKKFGESVATLVDGVTKFKKIPFATKEEQQSENVRKMLIIMSEDIRVIFIKLADRLHNMRTLEYMRPEKQRMIAKETLEIYAPLAHRLGIRPFKEELEDLAIYYLDTPGYKEIQELIKTKNMQCESHLEEIIEELDHLLRKEKFDFTIKYRVKSIYSIYRKVFMKARSFDEIYDIYAVRIIVKEKNDCYTVMGIVHSAFTPIQNRFKDYISTPKSNSYQSLHTTVLDRKEVPFEVQIRTEEMNRFAEYGLAAHWKYKLGINGKDKLDDYLSEIHELLDSESEYGDIVRSIKTDLSSDEVLVYTPKGDVKSLPAGSTIVDFAYMIHSEVGNRMMGAKVNGRIVPIDYEVQTGEIIEIIKNNSADYGPSRDWLSIAKTSKAREKIRLWLKRECQEENIQSGKSTILSHIKKNFPKMTSEELENILSMLLKKYSCNKIEELYEMVGYGALTIEKIISKIKDEIKRNNLKNNINVLPIEYNRPQNSKGKPNSIVVEGMDSVLVKFARCCNPLPGDAIIGFVTRGHGLSIHKQDCPNVEDAFKNNIDIDRWLPASWNSDIQESLVHESFNVMIRITAKDRDFLLSDVSYRLSNMHITIVEFNGKRDKDVFGESVIELTVSVTDIEQLNNVISNLRKINGVTDVRRTGK